jgi:cytochrome c oxidase subunit 3
MSALPIRNAPAPASSPSLAGSPLADASFSPVGSSSSTVAAAIEVRGLGVRGLRNRGLRGVDPARLGLWFFLATVIMLFAAFSSAYLVRMASGAWSAIELPSVLWISTAILVTSSATLELARLRLGSTATPWLAATLTLGLLFLAGQAAAWRALQLAGVFLPESPHAAFLYIFTALHGAHLAGGLIWLAVVWRCAARSAPAVGRPVVEDRLARCATYWHFMGGLWIYLFAVLHLR